jgi:hypothetical protein
VRALATRRLGRVGAAGSQTDPVECRVAVEAGVPVRTDETLVMDEQRESRARLLLRDQCDTPWRVGTTAG